MNTDEIYHTVRVGDRVKCLRFDSGFGVVKNVSDSTTTGSDDKPYRVKWDDGAFGIGWYSAEELDVIPRRWVRGDTGTCPPPTEYEIGDAVVEEQFVEKVWNTPENPGFGPQYDVDVDALEADDSSPLLKAHALVHGDRGRDYDHPYTDYLRTADIFRAMTGVELTVTQAVKFMMAVKLSRMQASPNVEDHMVDLAGYTECLHMVMEREAILSEGGF